MIGPEKASFWIFELADSAVVAPDCPPKLRRELLPALASPVRRMEGYCFSPPKRWSKARILLPPVEVVLKRISRQELADTMKTFEGVHEVREFGDEGL